MESVAKKLKDTIGGLTEILIVAIGLLVVVQVVEDKSDLLLGLLNQILIHWRYRSGQSLVVSKQLSRELSALFSVHLFQ